MKKVIACSLSICMILMMLPAQAIAAENNSEVHAESILWCSQPEALDDLFFTQSIEPFSNEPDAYTVDYTYDFEENWDNNTATVDLSFTISKGNQEYTISSTSIGGIRELTDDIHLLEANLQEEIVLNEDAYLANIGFTHILERPEVSITMTLAPMEDDSSFNDILLMNFGEPVITEEIREYLPELNEENEDDTPQDIGIAPLVTGELDTFYSPVTTKFSGYSSTRSAQELEAALDSDTYCIAVALKTYGDNAEAVIIDKYGNSSTSATALVSSFNIGLKVESGGGFLVGVEEMSAGSNNANTAILDLIESVLGDFGYSVSTIAALIRIVSDETFEVDPLWTNWIEVSSSSTIGISCFDDAAFPVVFQADDNSNGSTTFNAYSDVTYKVLTYITGYDTLTYYISATTANRTFTVDRG